MAAAVPKLLMQVGQRPILAHTLSAFEAANLVDEVLLVVAEPMMNVVVKEVVDIYGFQKVSKIISGGTTRQDSVYAGLKALDPSTQLVVIHDGARPLITPELIDLAVERAAQHQAVAVAVRPKDTIKRGDGQYLFATLNRSELWVIQTPQVFQRDLILSAHQQALREGYQATDDASLVEVLGKKVFVVEGRYDNIKVTTPEDLTYMEMVLRRRHGR